MEPAQITQLLLAQDGVIARHQALAAGVDATFVARRVRRRDWVPLHPGVYVAHTGQPTWRQQAWAAVLACWPAALDGASALRAYDGPGRRTTEPGRDHPIEVAVDHRRRVTAPKGVRLRRVRGLDGVVQWNLAPPRLRYEDAVLTLAERTTEDVTSIAVLADAVGGRRTTAERLRSCLERRARARRRDWLERVLDDIGHGTCSVLEHAYLTRVERPHGLPRGTRQVRTVGTDGRPQLRDIRYGGRGWTQWVELDGHAFHSTPRQRDRDLERDLDAALHGQPTVRLGWAQVVGRPCATAAKVACLLRRRGWPGTAHPCPECSADAQWGGSDQAG